MKVDIYGLLLISIYILSNRYNLLPSFIDGILISTSIVFLFIGLCSINYDIKKLRNYKINFLFQARK